jgi:hypothetical protein
MGIEIGRIRAHYRHSRNGIDTATLRLRLSHGLGSAELHPTTIPPSAILVVRHLTAPLPVHLARWPGESRRQASWERTTRQALLDIYRRAGRPGQGYVPASSEAVVFADIGEMLACLALDMSQGQAPERWWWRTLLRTPPSLSAAGLTTLLCHRAAAVPAALHYLSRHGKAALVLQTLSPPQAMAVLDAMGQAYGLADFCPGALWLQGPSEALADAPHPQAQVSTRRALSSSDTATLSPATIGREMTVTPPWQAALVPPYLGQHQAYLLGVGLSLYNQPAMVRSRAFLAQLQAWWSASAPSLVRQEATAVAGGSMPLPHRREMLESSTEGQGEAVLPVVLEQAALAVSPPFPIDHARAQREIHVFDQEINPPSHIAPDTARSAMVQESGTQNGAEASTEAISESTVVSIQPEESLQPDARGQTDVPLQIPATELEQQSPAVAVSEAVLQLEHGIETTLGGVLYLINLMCKLDLPACFAAAWELDSQVGPWGMLELLGRGMLAGEQRASPADPLWMALAQLGGRVPGELPGAAVQGSDYFALPITWVTQAPSGEDVYYWATRHQRLCLWSAAGYVLLECPRNTSPSAAQASVALQGYLASSAPQRLLHTTFDRAPLDSLSGPLVTGCNPSLAHWLALVLPFLRHRLQRALQSEATEAFDLAQMLLLSPGRLYVTATHVDLVMRLEDISLPVRIAGLDRNPGWLPDFGRVVLFHFE